MSTTETIARRPAWWVIAGAELRLILRNRTVLLSATAMPLALSLLLLLMGQRGVAAGLGELAGTQLIMLLAFTVYVTATMTLTARRQDLLLKRLRSSAASTAGVVAGLSLPLCALLLAQVAVVFTITGWEAGQAPQRPALLALAIVVGCLTCIGLAFLTAAFTRTTEAAQLTTFPLFLVLIGGVVWVNMAPAQDAHPGMLAVPGAAVAHLTRLGWDSPLPADSGLLAAVVPAVAAAVAVAAAACYAAARLFRWDPRN